MVISTSNKLYTGNKDLEALKSRQKHSVKAQFLHMQLRVWNLSRLHGFCQFLKKLSARIAFIFGFILNTPLVRRRSRFLLTLWIDTNLARLTGSCSFFSDLQPIFTPLDIRHGEFAPTLTTYRKPVSANLNVHNNVAAFAV
jgi:hypothetical protein